MVDQIRTATPRRAFVVLGVVGVLATTALLGMLREPAASEVDFTPSQRARYLAEMKENLNGHPGDPRFHLVSKQILVRQAVIACEWLAMQPAGDAAQTSSELRLGYFEEHPRVDGEWPFEHGSSDLRSEILTNAWAWLCGDIAEDHVDQSPNFDD